MESNNIRVCDIKLLKSKLGPGRQSPGPPAERPPSPPKAEIITIKCEPLDLSFEPNVSIKAEYQSPPSPCPQATPSVWLKASPPQDIQPPLGQVIDQCDTDVLSELHTDRLADKLNSISPREDGRFPCDACEHTFDSAGSLYRHSRVHVPAAAHVCCACQQAFPSRALLLRHQRNACQFDDKLTCPVCGQRFLLDSRLQSHLRVHSAERPFECDVCAMAFKWKCTLARHMQLHDGRKPFRCPVCSKAFTQAGLIRPHMRAHTGEQPFQCPVCLQRFSHKHNMERHQLRHNKVKRLVCEVCGKQFPRESRLKYHMRVHWADPRPFKCRLCAQAFSHKQNVVRHYRRRHPGREYQGQETDASVATQHWAEAMRRERDADTGYIVPESGTPAHAAPEGE